ncbi:MAG: hypothetical protein ACQESP_10455, partial [Candidatus Muiribacteriota bacterium]
HCGVLFKILQRNIILIYDSHEWWSERRALYNNYQKFSIRLKEFLFTKFTNLNITVNNAIANKLKLFNFVNFKVLYNTSRLFNLKEKNEMRKKFNLPKNKIIIIYTGILTSGRGIEVLFQILNNLPERFLGVIMGKCREGFLENNNLYKKLINDNKLIHLESKPEQEMYEYICASDLGFNGVEKICRSYNLASPTKTFYYMMAGVPNLFNSELTFSKMFNKKYNVGILIDYKDIEKTVNQIREFLFSDRYNQCRKNSLFYAKNIFNWQRQEKKLSKIFFD